MAAEGIRPILKSYNKLSQAWPELFCRNVAFTSCLQVRVQMRVQVRVQVRGWCAANARASTISFDFYRAAWRALLRCWRASGARFRCARRGVLIGICINNEAQSAVCVLFDIPLAPDLLRWPMRPVECSSIGPRTGRWCAGPSMLKLDNTTKKY